MLKYTLFMLSLFAFACTDEPVPTAVSPDDEVTNNSPKPGDHNQKITSYSWILRDKNGDIVNAMVNPSTPFDYRRAEKNIDLTKVIEYPNVILTSINGELIRGHNIFSLRTGQPVGLQSCQYIFDDEQCSSKYSWSLGLCLNENQNTEAYFGPPDLEKGRQTYMKNQDGSCVPWLKVGDNFNIYPRKTKPIPKYYENILTNSPYTLSYEKLHY